MKTYIGTRGPTGCAVTVCDEAGAWPLPPRLDLRSHSPAGFEWGHRGSGPAQLALAVLANHTGNDQVAEALHQAFEREVIAAIRGDAFRLTSDDVEAWLAAPDPRPVPLGSERALARVRAGRRP